MTPVLVVALAVILGVAGAIVHLWGWWALALVLIVLVGILIATKGDGSDEP